MPAQYPGNTATKPARAATGGGFESAIEVGGGGSGSGISVSYTGTGIGETVTISTSTLDFTAKANANPFWYVDPGAEGTIAASPLSRLQVSLSGRPLGTLDTVTKHGPNGAAKAEQVGTSPDWRVPSGSIGPTQGTVTTDDYGAGEHIRIISRFRRNFDGLDLHDKQQELNPDGVGWNIKRWRWWSGSGAVNNVHINGGQTSATSGDPRITAENTDGTERPQTNKEFFGFLKNQWLSETHEIRQSSAPDVFDGFWRAIVNGYEFLYSGMRTKSDSLSLPDSYRQLVMEQWQFVFTDVPFIIWHDHIYVDDTPHALIVTNKPTWGEADAVIDPLIPTAWGSTEITAKTRCDITGRYLYVFDGTGALLNQTGVAL